VVSVGPPVGSLLRVGAIYGANASGKTNILRAMSFFRLAVRNSQQRWEHDEPIPIERFALGNREEMQTRMCLDFLVNGVRHEYGFTINDREFLTEWLHVYVLGRKQVWFERTDSTNIKFGPKLQTTANREMNVAISKMVRPNSLLLSAAVQNNYEELKPIQNAIVRGWIALLDTRENLVHKTARISFEQADLKRRITRLMRAADLGLIDYEFVEEEADEKTKTIINALISTMPDPKDPDLPTAPYKVPKVSFTHRSSETSGVKFEASQESAGTLAYFGLMGPICDALENGSFIFIDEIESSLHPNLAALIVQLFNNSRTNPKNAQLVFTTHEVTLLTECALRRDQIWFTEKDRNGVTTLFPLSDFHIRNDEKISKGYLQGRFGGIPNVDQILALNPPEDEVAR